MRQVQDQDSLELSAVAKKIHLWETPESHNLIEYPGMQGPFIAILEFLRQTISFCV